jgi:hypothetical protein
MGHFAVDEPALNPLFETIAGLRVYWEAFRLGAQVPPAVAARRHPRQAAREDHVRQRPPSLPYDRILREWDELGYDQTVMDLVFHANAERVLGL